MDLISRKAAIDALISEGRSVDSRYISAERIIHESDAIEAISMLPPAEQKKAKWSCSDDMYETAICAACDWNSQEPFDYILKHFNFCPNCGAKMEVSE